MTDARVLRVKRSDKSVDPYVLIHVTKRGPGSLDLLLVGTEGTTGFATSVKQDDIAGYRASKYSGDEDEWRAVLSFALLGVAPEHRHRSVISSLDLSASVEADAQILLGLKQTISGITQRLGEVSLIRDDKQEIELFDWTALAAKNASDSETRIYELQERCESQEAMMRKLSSQLEDFTRVKQQHEKELLEKFRQLLNSKKLKIRDQQRLISTVKVDPGMAAQIDRQREVGEATKGKSSRPTKRKQSDGTAEQALPYRTVVKDETDEERRITDAQTPERSDSSEEPTVVETSSHTKTRQVGSPKASRALSQKDATNAVRGDSNLGVSANSIPHETPSTRQAEILVDEDDEETDDEL